MNERIQELAQQSQLAELYDRYVEQCMKNADDDILDYDVIVKEFAELIVRECVKFCEHESNDDEHDEYDMGMWVKAESIKTAIMEEFGIKE
jgi:hypothetical protein